MFANNFYTHLTAPLAIDGDSLPVPQDALETIRARGLKVSISDKTNPAWDEVEIVQFDEYGQLLRGLEGSVIKEWPEETLCYCSVTAESAMRLFTPAVAYTDKKEPLRGSVAAPPVSARHVKVSSDYTDAYIVTSRFGDPQQIEASISIDGGASFMRPITSSPGEEAVASAVARDSDDLYQVLITRPAEGEGLFIYRMDLRRLKRSRHEFTTGAGHSIASNCLIPTAVDGQTIISLIDTEHAYFFDVSAGVDYLGRVQITGEWTSSRPALSIPQQNYSGSGAFIDEEGRAWTGSFKYSAEEPEWNMAEISAAWFVPPEFDAAFMALPDSGSAYCISAAGEITNTYGSTISVPVYGSVTGLVAGPGSSLYVGDSAGFIWPVKITWGSPSFSLGTPFVTTRPPRAIVATEKGVLYTSEDDDGLPALYLAPYGGSADGVYADGYMPGETLRNIMGQLSDLQSRVEQLENE